LLLRPPGPPGEAALLGFVAGVALAESVAALAPAAPAVALKWPNDALIGGRKFAGILLESEGARAGGVDALILGLGVNLVAHPADAEFPATDLGAHGVALAPAALLEAFVAAFARGRALLAAAGFAPLRAAWLARAHGLGGRLRVRLAAETIEGVFADLDSDGLLLLDAPGGRRRISAGDVFFGPPV
jgi:BirA family biotin operon repressor/biotin-[acetyl-CoA-carboxylase] ligase